MTRDVDKARQAGTSEFFSEAAHEPMRELQHFGENGYDWHDLSRANLIERYLNGKISLWVKGWVSIGVPNRVQFSAVIRNCPVLKKCRQILKLNIGIYGHSIPNHRALRDHNQEAVLIANVKFVNDSNSGIVRRLTAVWLHLGNFPKVPPSDSLYLSARDRLFEFLPINAHRKLMLVQGALPVLDCQCDYKVIHTGSELVDDLASKDREAEWWMRAIAAPNIASAIVFELSDDSVRGRVSLEEGVDLGIEIDDILFGPLPLRFDTI